MRLLKLWLGWSWLEWWLAALQLCAIRFSSCMSGQTQSDYNCAMLEDGALASR